MRTGNPMLTAETFAPSKLFQIEDRASSTMTLSGTVMKTAEKWDKAKWQGGM